MLTQRQKKICEILRRHTWLKGKELAAMLGVTDRTIRSDIETINMEGSGQTIEGNPQKGYHLIREKTDGSNAGMTRIPQTPLERQEYIVRTLLFDKRELNMYELPEQLCASMYTIEADVKTIRTHLTQYGNVRLAKQKNWIWLEGQEGSKRKLCKDMLNKELEDNFSNLNEMIGLYPKFDLLRVKETLETILEEHDYKIRPSSMPMLLMHIGIAIERMLNFHYLENKDVENGLSDTIEYQIASTFFARISRQIPIEINEAEIRLLTLLLLGKRSKAYTQEEVETGSTMIRIPDLVQTMLDDVYQRFDIDLRADRELRNGMELHIRSLLMRHEQNVSVDNVYLNDIKIKFPLIFEMGVQAARALEQQLDFTISESEISFLALHLGNAFNRLQSSGKYQVVMIFPDDQSLARRCKEKIESRFGDRIEITAQMNVFEKESIERLEPDLILSSVYLKHDLPVPTLTISLFMNYEDESEIFQALNQLDKKRTSGQFQRMIRELIIPDFFYPHLQAENEQEVIETMCNTLTEKGYVGKDYYTQVLERERTASTSFYTGFALPHTFEGTVLKPAISIAILDKPLRWGQFDVQLVILLAIRDVDQNLLRVFFDWLAHFVSDEKQFQDLINQRDVHLFIETITKEEER